MKLMILGYNKALGINKDNENFKEMARKNEEESKELRKH